MLRRLLILLCFLALPFVSMADDRTPLHKEPKQESKIIGMIKDTDVMIMLEQNGIWAKVVDVETGLVGWLILPAEEEGA